MNDSEIIDCLVSAGFVTELNSDMLKKIMTALPNQDWKLLKILVALKIAEQQ